MNTKTKPRIPHVSGPEARQFVVNKQKEGDDDDGGAGNYFCGDGDALFVRLKSDFVFDDPIVIADDDPIVIADDDTEARFE